MKRWLLISPLLSLVACGAPDSEAGTVRIGLHGGRITVGQAEVVFHPGALDSDTEIRLRRGNDSDEWILEAEEGVTLRLPAELRLPVDDPQEPLGLDWTRPAGFGPGEDTLPAWLEDGRLIAQVPAFGRGRVHTGSPDGWTVYWYEELNTLWDGPEGLEWSPGWAQGWTWSAEGGDIASSGEGTLDANRIARLDGIHAAATTYTICLDGTHCYTQPLRSRHQVAPTAGRYEVSGQNEFQIAASGLQSVDDGHLYRLCADARPGCGYVEGAQVVEAGAVEAGATEAGLGFALPLPMDPARHQAQLLEYRIGMEGDLYVDRLVASARLPTEAVDGAYAVSLTPVTPGRTLHIQIDGEAWEAAAPGALQALGAVFVYSTWAQFSPRGDYGAELLTASGPGHLFASGVTLQIPESPLENARLRVEVVVGGLRVTMPLDALPEGPLVPPAMSAVRRLTLNGQSLPGTDPLMLDRITADLQGGIELTWEGGDPAPQHDLAHCRVQSGDGWQRWLAEGTTSPFRIPAEGMPANPASAVCVLVRRSEAGRALEPDPTSWSSGRMVWVNPAP